MKYDPFREVAHRARLQPTASINAQTSYPAFISAQGYNLAYLNNEIHIYYWLSAILILSKVMFCLYLYLSSSARSIPIGAKAHVFG